MRHMSTLRSDLFFTAYVPVTAYVAWYALHSRWPAGSSVLLSGDAAFFRSPADAFVVATMITLACVTWSLVYAAQMLLGARKRILWQLGMLLLPFAAPPCFYLFVVRHRPPAHPRSFWAKAALGVVLSGGIPGGLGMAAGRLYPEAMHLLVLVGMFVVGGFWGFAFWSGRSRGVDEFFRSLRAAAAAGAVYGITVEGLLLPSVAGVGATVWIEALRALGSVYWGAAGAAFATCCIVVVPGLLYAEFSGLHRACGRTTTRDGDVR